jgi:hypothetical protein
MSKQFLFIDDSGDTGLKDSATTHFVVAAVLIVDRKNLDTLRLAMDGFRAGLGWNELHELKFNTTKKSIIINLLKFIKQFDFKAYAIVLDKSKMKNESLSDSEESLYNFVIKELLLRLDLKKEPSIVIDGVAHKRHAERTRNYLRQALKEQGIAKCKISFVDSRKDVIIQLADVIAGSVARSYNENKANSDGYLKLIKPKIKRIYEINP